MKGKEDKIAVLVGSVTDDIRAQEVVYLLRIWRFRGCVCLWILRFSLRRLNGLSNRGRLMAPHIKIKRGEKNAILERISAFGIGGIGKKHDHFPNCHCDPRATPKRPLPPPWRTRGPTERLINLCLKMQKL